MTPDELIVQTLEVQAQLRRTREPLETAARKLLDTENKQRIVEAALLRACEEVAEEARNLGIPNPFNKRSNAEEREAYLRVRLPDHYSQLDNLKAATVELKAELKTAEMIHQGSREDLRVVEVIAQAITGSQPVYERS